MVAACEPARNPQPTPERGVQPSSETLNELSHARQVKKRHDDRLMAIPGVVGTGIAQDAKGQPIIEVYVERLTKELSRKVPEELEGVRVRIVETGEFKAR